MSTKDKLQTNTVTWDEAYGQPPVEITSRYQLDPISEQGTWETTDEAEVPFSSIYKDAIGTSKGPGQFHECDHQSVWLGFNPLIDSIMVVDNPPLVGHYRYSTQCCIVWDWLRITYGIPRMGQLIDQEYTIQWLKAMGDKLAKANAKNPKSPLDAGFGGVNFLLEIQDLGRIFKTLRNHEQSLRRLFGRSNRKLTYAEFFRNLTDGILAVNFGVLPLISDVQKVYKIFCTWRKTWDELVRGKVRTYKYGREDIAMPVAVGEVPGMGTSRRTVGKYKGVGGIWSYAYRHETTWKGYMRYNFRLEPTYATKLVNLYGPGRTYQDPAKHPYAGFLVLLDMLGLNFDPEQIWDSIPFSFILDWMYDFGSLFEDFKSTHSIAIMTVMDSMQHVSSIIHRDWYYDDTFQFSETCKTFSRRRHDLDPVTKQRMMKKLKVKHLFLASTLLGQRHLRPSIINASNLL